MLIGNCFRKSLPIFSRISSKICTCYRIINPWELRNPQGEAYIILVVSKNNPHRYVQLYWVTVSVIVTDNLDSSKDR